MVYKYDQIKEKDNLGNEHLSDVCRCCNARADIWAEASKKYPGKCDISKCCYRDKDIDINQTLKPCPICGSNNIIVGLGDASEYGALWHVKCQDCGLKNTFTDDLNKIDVYVYWNNRRGK